MPAVNELKCRDTAEKKESKKERKGARTEKEG